MFPTWPEAKPFMERYGGEFFVTQAGIGTAECAARTAKIVSEQNPGIIILAGIAGALPGQGIHKGDTVLVEREVSADLGTVSSGKFRTLPKDTAGGSVNYYDCRTPLPDIFPKVISNTVNTAGTSYVDDLMHAHIENMEGAGFFALCNALDIPCMEIRTISNYVGEARSEWAIPQAISSLAENLARLLHTITSL